MLFFIDKLIIGILSIIIILFAYITITFYKENEKRPSFISFLSGVIIGLPFLFYFLFYFDNKLIITTVILCLALLFFLVLLIPLKNKKNLEPGVVLNRIDERDIMFSRNELIPQTERFNDYYKRKPENKVLDDKFRSKPGLCSNKATKYHSFKFASADANFETVDIFKAFIKNETVSAKKQAINVNELSDYIKKWAKQLGVVSIGFTELKDHHLYSVKGRGEEYGDKIVQNHPFAIAFTVEMDKDMLDMAPNAETVIESAQQYLNAGNIAVQLSLFIRNLGYSARPHIDGNYQVVCPVVSKDAGLGEFGRMGLLMTPELGPRVRIGVVTTDIPLITDEYKYESSVVDFCTSCKKCSDNCPSAAISFDDMEEIDGIVRWKINHEACFTYWSIIGTDCGKCVQVCPYSHPNNLMHNVVRNGIKNSYLFGEFALKMDDLFYGRKPDFSNRKSVLD